MAHSIEGRVPFPDHHVIECLRQVPVSLKIRGTTEKHILCEATRSMITDTVSRREKHPFLSPPVTTLPGERFHEMLQDTLRGPVLASLPFYDQKNVVALLDQLPGLSDQDRTQRWNDRQLILGGSDPLIPDPGPRPCLLNAVARKKRFPCSPRRFFTSFAGHPGAFRWW
ncbi:MAG: asparagine synthase-related protein [Verrucomicrobiales bacterium]